MQSIENVDPIDLHKMLGATQVGKDAYRFCVWSPKSRSVSLQIEGRPEPIPLDKTPGGYHQIEVGGVKPGDRYQYYFDEFPGRPDPASRFQPDGVHGPSQVVCPDFEWTDSDWKGVPRSEWVIYELHIGTFTEIGTFASAIDRLDELVELGVTAIELMPVADSPGKWNWGYDGVNLFAPNRNYGSPDDLRRLVDAAHAKGLAVFLDVVYNHLGPEGNYLGEIGPYLSRRHQTPWGAGPNFDHAKHGTQLRRFFVANVIYWLEEFHFDGLRIDAIHCMADDSDQHVVVEMAEAVQAYRNQSGRDARLIAESNLYNADITRPIQQGGCGFDAQWSDCFLHSVFSTLRPGEQLTNRGYREDQDLDQAVRMGFVYEGGFGKEPVRMPLSDRVDTSSLIYSIQNHDFIGNHPLGLRLHQLASAEAQRAAAALMILSPAIPMLFMGEEFACEHPFQFFVDFGDSQLRRSVVKGRRREYPQHDWSTGASPVKPAAFHQSKIGDRSDGDAGMVRWYQDLLRLRRTWIASGLLCDAAMEVESQPQEGLFVMRYRNHDDRATVAVRLNSVSSNAVSSNATPMDWKADGEILLDSNGTHRQNGLDPNHAIVMSP